jgi:hypothetical protein
MAIVLDEGGGRIMSSDKTHGRGMILAFVAAFATLLPGAPRVRAREGYRAPKG